MVIPKLLSADTGLDSTSRQVPIIACRRSPSLLYLDTIDVSTPSTINWVLGLVSFRSPESPRLTVKMRLEGLDDRDVSDTLDVTVFRLQPSVTSLNFHDCNDEGTVRILEALSTPTIADVHETHGSWLCPDLAFISLRLCDFNPKVVLDSVTRRTQAATMGEDGTSTGRVTRVRDFQLYECRMVNASTFRQIEEVLGEDAACIWLADHEEDAEGLSPGMSDDNDQGDGDESMNYSGDE